LSVAETNKLRAKLGLAPLELEDSANTEPVEKDDGSGEKVSLLIILTIHFHISV
jgi:hypothetical protein